MSTWERRALYVHEHIENLPQLNNFQKSLTIHLYGQLIRFVSIKILILIDPRSKLVFNAYYLNDRNFLISILFEKCFWDK